MSDESKPAEWYPLSIRGNEAAENVYRDTQALVEKLAQGRDDSEARASLRWGEALRLQHELDAANIRLTQALAAKEAAERAMHVQNDLALERLERACAAESAASALRDALLDAARVLESISDRQYPDPERTARTAAKSARSLLAAAPPHEEG